MTCWKWQFTGNSTPHCCLSVLHYCNCKWIMVLKYISTSTSCLLHCFSYILFVKATASPQFGRQLFCLWNVGYCTSECFLRHCFKILSSCALYASHLARPTVEVKCTTLLYLSNKHHLFQVFIQITSNKETKTILQCSDTNFKTTQTSP